MDILDKKDSIVVRIKHAELVSIPGGVLSKIGFLHSTGVDARMQDRLYIFYKNPDDGATQQGIVVRIRVPLKVNAGIVPAEYGVSFLAEDLFETSIFRVPGDVPFQVSRRQNRSYLKDTIELHEASCVSARYGSLDHVVPSAD